jgi:hypothetical protein
MEVISMAENIKLKDEQGHQADLRNLRLSAKGDL